MRQLSKILLFSFFFFLSSLTAVIAQDIDREIGLVTPDPFWRQALGGNILSLPSVQAGSAVVALDGGSVKAYSAAGTPMWTFGARGRISPHVSRSREGSSYFTRTNGVLIALNRSGRELWRRNIGGQLTGKVIPGWDGRLFIPIDKKLFCMTAAGSFLWTKTFDHSYLIPPKLDRNGGVIFALNNNEVFQINAFGKTESWQLSATPISILHINENRLAAVHIDGTIEVIGEDDDWFLAAGEEGQPAVLPRVPGRPIMAVSRGNNIVALNNEGETILISIEERKILWSADSHIREYNRRGMFSRADLSETEIVYDERGIYILNKNGATSLSHDGRRLWFTFLSRQAAVPAFGHDGILYAGGRDWILYAYRLEDRILQVRGNIFGPEPEGTYGTGVVNASYMPSIPLFSYEISNALESMEPGIFLGNVGENELAWTSMLLTISANQNETIPHRIRAIQLLGKIGSRETVPHLTNIFRRDRETLIRAAAVTAIGDIGVDPDGMAITAFHQAVIPANIRDEQLIMAITRATGDICRFSGPPLADTGVRILSIIANTPTLPVGVKTHAEKELASLR